MQNDKATSPATSPFFRVSKNALYKVINSIDGTEACYVLAVYTALCLIANGSGKGDQSAPFTATIAHIASKCGLRYRKTIDAIGWLRELGLIAVKRRAVAGSKLKGPSEYTLCTIDTSMCEFEDETGAESSNNLIRTCKNLRTKETRKLKSKEMIAVPTLEQALEYGESADHPKEIVSSWWHLNERKGWTTRDKLTGKAVSIGNWPKAMDAFVTAVNKTPPQARVTYGEFWKWVEENRYDPEIVEKWFEFNESKEWMRLNPLTGLEEPIFDWKSSFRAFTNKVDVYGDS